jgi:hypothetical protein
MQNASYCVFVCGLLACGCAGLVNQVGKDLSDVKNRQEVHAKLGEPASTGVAEGKAYEEFHTRQKIAGADQRLFGGPGYAMGVYMTCGLSEVVLFPYELSLVGRRALFGQTVRVTYEADDAVAYVLLDGVPPGMWWLRPRPTEATQDKQAHLGESGPSLTGPGSPPVVQPGPE